METLTRSSSSSWVFSENFRGGDGDLNFLSPPREVLIAGTPQIRFLSSTKHVSVGFPHSISLKHRGIRPVCVSSLSPPLGTQKRWSNEETQIQDTSKTVHVKFHLQKECAFGEQFHIVGDDPMFGSWDPSSAIPLNWSNGHVWTVDLDIPIGKTIQFKFLLKGIAGNIFWQPGSDRIFQTWETKNTIAVSEDWDNAELQMIVEEEPGSNEKEESTIIPETLFFVENLAQPNSSEKVESRINLSEKSMARSISYAKEEPIHVLVPNVTLLTALDAEGTSPPEVNNNVVAPDYIAKEHNVPEVNV
ncbi:hypothetical protein U1Q18_013540 [Sarracenia purpurea var. burkii]